jgi:tRNA threonylcarbamoyl adenosine modification protein YeaZ
LAPAIHAAVADAGVTTADLTEVAVGVGPGPFTGLRVGVVTALTLGSTLGLRTHGVCSLDILAAELVQDGGIEAEFLVATDARRKEVYWAHYRPQGERAERLDGPHVSYPADLATLHAGMPVLGRGATLYPDELVALDGPLDPSAAALARAVAAGSVEELPLEPLYLRRPDAAPLVMPKQA